VITEWSSIDQFGIPKRLQRQIHRAILADRTQRTTDVGETIKYLLSCDKLREAWRVLKAWYRHWSGRASQPSKTDLEELKEEYISLLAEHSPTGDPIPILVAPFRINESIPTDEEIGKSVG
jgi:hypothetical protein